MDQKKVYVIQKVCCTNIKRCLFNFFFSENLYLYNLAYYQTEINLLITLNNYGNFLFKKKLLKKIISGKNEVIRILIAFVLKNFYGK